jgi:hypothetical protein
VRTPAAPSASAVSKKRTGCSAIGPSTPNGERVGNRTGLTLPSPRNATILRWLSQPHPGLRRSGASTRRWGPLGSPRPGARCGTPLGVGTLQTDRRSGWPGPSGGLAGDLSDDLGIDARIAEQTVRHRVFDVDHRYYQGDGINEVAVTTIAVAARQLERLFEPARDAHAAGEERGAAPRRTPPWLPWLMDAAAAEPVERVISEGAANRGADLLEVDAHELQQFGVGRSRRFAHDLGQPAPDILGSRKQAADGSGQQVAVAYQAEEEVLGADIVVPKFASLLERRVDDSHGARVAAIEHCSAPGSSTNVVLLVDGLPGDADGWIATVDGVVELGDLPHAVSHG